MMNGSIPPVKSTTPGTMKAASHKDISRVVVVGACLGLAWGLALRAWMVMLALKFGERPKFTWRGTFGGILLPAALVGAWLGAAIHAAETSSSKRWVSGLLASLLTLAAGIGLFLGKGASEVFGALYFILLMALLVTGVSAPFRYQSKQEKSK
jgi:hypothetical protein